MKNNKDLSEQTMEEILKNKDENFKDFSLKTAIAQAEINTKTEVLDIEKKINDQEAIIAANYASGENFSISKLYKAEIELEMLNKKLAWINAKASTLFKTKKS